MTERAFEVGDRVRDKGGMEYIVCEMPSNRVMLRYAKGGDTPFLAYVQSLHHIPRTDEEIAQAAWEQHRVHPGGSIPSWWLSAARYIAEEVRRDHS